MTFMKIRNYNVKIVAVKTGIYFDMLKPMIEKHTGLYTSMGTMGKTVVA